MVVKHEPGPHKSSHFVRARIAHEMTSSARQPGRKPRLNCTFGVEVKGLHCESVVRGVLTRDFPMTFLVAALRSPQVPSRSLGFPHDKDM
jgi:hypothetical protein